jgi:hypothetical protein
MAGLVTLLAGPAMGQHVDAVPSITIEIKDSTSKFLDALGALHPAPEETLISVAALLHADKPIHIRLVASAGAIEHHAVTVSEEGVPTVVISLEGAPLQTSETMAHAMTHAVQISMGSKAGGIERSIGETVLAEGLAMRVARNLFPAEPETDFIETRPGWFADANAKRGRILLDVRAVLNDSDRATVARFTSGTGPAGLECEAYYVAWLVTGYWLSHGESYAEIARVKAQDAPTRVAEAIDKLLAEGRR